MRLAAHAMLLCAGTLSAQNIAEPGKIADFIKLLKPQPKDQRLQCTVKIVKPGLDYAFQFESGYSFQAPLKQFSGPGHNWAVLTEVTPQDVNASPCLFFRLWGFAGSCSGRRQRGSEQRLSAGGRPLQRQVGSAR